jgi:hypothetical protein
MFSGVVICVPSGCYDMYVDLGMKKSKVEAWNSYRNHNNRAYL